MATIKANLTGSGAITITSMVGITFTSFAGSLVITNTSNLYLDVYVQVKIKTGIGVDTVNGKVNVYGYGSVDNGTTYSDGTTGTDAIQTYASNRTHNLSFLGAITAKANTTTYVSNPFSFAMANGGVIPEKWGIVVENLTGATFDNTAGNFSAKFVGILLTSA